VKYPKRNTIWGGGSSKYHGVNQNNCAISIVKNYIIRSLL